MRRKSVVIGALALLLLAGCSREQKSNYQAAMENLDAGLYENALEQFQQSVSNQYHLLESYQGAGIACLKLGQYEEAIQMFDQALQSEKVKDEMKKNLLQYKITAELKAKIYDSAQADCQELSNFKMDEQSYFLRGCAQLALNSYDEANRDFQSAFALDDSIDMAMAIYQVYMEKDMEADGVSYLEASLKENPSTPEECYNQARVYYCMEDYDKALEILSGAVESEHTNAILLQADVYLAKNDLENAYAMYEKYIEKAENPAEGYNGLALCKMNQGNYTEALQNLEQAEKTAMLDQKREIWFNQIVSYEKLFEYEKAYEKVKAYLVVYPDDAEADKERCYLATRIQEWNNNPTQNSEESTQENSGETAAEDAADNTTDSAADSTDGAQETEDTVLDETNYGYGEDVYNTYDNTYNNVYDNTYNTYDDAYNMYDNGYDTNMYG